MPVTTLGSQYVLTGWMNGDAEGTDTEHKQNGVFAEGDLTTEA